MVWLGGTSYERMRLLRHFVPRNDEKERLSQGGRRGPGNGGKERALAMTKRRGSRNGGRRKPRNNEKKRPSQRGEGEGPGNDQKKRPSQRGKEKAGQREVGEGLLTTGLTKARDGAEENPSQ